MSRRDAILYTVLFSAVIAITGIVAAVNLSMPAEKRMLNGELAKAIETRYDEKFPVKQLGVNLWAAIDYTLFREGRPGVVVGNQGWLYTDEEFDAGDRAAATLKRNLEEIEKTREALASAGVQLVAAVVPAKARVYNEYIADRKPASAHVALYDELLSALTARSIPTVDLRGTLTSGKHQELTYFRTDTHWTPFGAQLAASEIAKVTRSADLIPDEAATYVTRTVRRDTHRGDLCNFLPLAPWFDRLLPAPEDLDVMQTEQSGSEGSASADLFGDSSIPSIVLVGTSYSANPLWNFIGALKQSLSADIASYAREGHGPFEPMAAYLQSEDFREHPPRLVIWEIPERSLLSVPPPT